MRRPSVVKRCERNFLKSIGQLFTVMHRATEKTLQILDLKGQSSRSRLNKISWKQHFEGEAIHSVRGLSSSSVFHLDPVPLPNGGLGAVPQKIFFKFGNKY